MAIVGIVSSQTAATPAGIASALKSLSLSPSWTRAELESPGFRCGVTSGTQSAYVAKHGSITVCCDADLWNRDELAAKSGMPSSNPALQIAVLYEKFGEDVLLQLRGQFALAIYEERESRLLVAIDPIGISPLVYSTHNGDLCFASQPRGIFAARPIPREVNYEAIASFLNFTIVPAPESAFLGITKLESGTCLRWSHGAAQIHRYWDMTYPEDAREGVSSLSKKLLANMAESVAASGSGVEDAQLGCFLSGGTDSSSVVGLLTRDRKKPVNTFSIGFAEERFNELEYAHLAVKHFGARHHEAKINAATAFNTLTNVVDAYDEPFGNASIIPTYHCIELAREAGMTTMLAGDGGDELFGGNERYRTDQIFQIYFRLPEFARKGFLEPMLSHLPDFLPQVARAKRYVNACNRGNPERYCAWLPLCRYSPEEILGDRVPTSNGSSDMIRLVRRHYAAAPAKTDLNRLLYVDMKMTLADNDLPKVVRAAEMVGIRVRFPYLDRSLAEFSGRIPANLKVRGFEKRFLFKKATAELLPQEILKKKKHGFGLPVGMWLKSDPQFHALAKDVLLDPQTYQRGYFRRPFVEWLFREMETDNTSVYYGDTLWIFLMLELWHRAHVESTSGVAA